MWTDRQTDMYTTILITAPLLRIYGDKLPTDSNAANQADAAIAYYSRIAELGDIRFRNPDSDSGDAPIV